MKNFVSPPEGVTCCANSHPSCSSYDTYIMLVTIIPNFALFGSFTTDHFPLPTLRALSAVLENTRRDMISIDATLGAQIGFLAKRGEVDS